MTPFSAIVTGSLVGLGLTGCGTAVALAPQSPETAAVCASASGALAGVSLLVSAALFAHSKDCRPIDPPLLLAAGFVRVEGSCFTTYRRGFLVLELLPTPDMGLTDGPRRFGWWLAVGNRKGWDVPVRTWGKLRRLAAILEQPLN